MKLRVPEYDDVRKNWKLCNYASDQFLVYDRHNKNIPVTFGTLYSEKGTTRLSFYVVKAYWAKGRKMRIESTIPGINSGEYEVTWKAEANSYDKTNCVIVEYVTCTAATPKDALKWLMMQADIQEAKDGLTTEKIVANLRTW